MKESTIKNLRLKRLTQEEIKKVQLEVLKEFHDFCMAHSLKYSLCAGTLLGAIRHKGYIPWDDDIDVMMPRREYLRLLNIYKSDDFTLYHYSRKKSYMITYAKLCSNKTYVVEGVTYESDYGVDIDIFPLDFFPDTKEESQKWSDHLGLLKDIRNVKNIKLSHSRSLWKNIRLAFLHLLALPIPMHWLVKRVDKVAQKYAYKTDGFLGNMTNGYRMKERNPMAKGLIDVDFEGHTFKAIDNYDEYLRGLFNDYMQLPPEDKRKSTHVFKAYWRSDCDQ